MRAAMLLGVRLAVGKGGQRARSLATLIASAVGVALLQLVWRIAQTRVGATTAFDQGAVSLLIAGTVGMVALPVLVLVATMARLSAQVRDRRLSTLRLLGLSTGLTRLVAVTETGLASLAGSVVGTVAMATVPSLRGSLAPDLLLAAGALVVVVGVSVATAALPPRVSSRRPVRFGRDGQRSVSLLRLLPLVAGFVVCWATRSSVIDHQSTLPGAEVAAIVVGVLLLGVGMLLVIPVFMSLVAAAVLWVGRGPSALLLGRRLQTQPASATRVIAALMIGLFVVVGARGVVQAFMTTPQYEHAADFVQRGQNAEVTASAHRASSTVEALRSVRGVQHVTSYRVLWGTTPTPHGSVTEETDEMTVLVATCSQLAGMHELAGCSDDAVNLINEPLYFHPNAEAIRVQASAANEGHGRAVTVPLRGATTIDPAAFDRAVGAMQDTPVVVVSPDTLGISALLPRTDRLVVARAGPGRFLYHRVENAGFRINSYVDLENYDFVRGMLTLVWTLAAVVLSIGLLTFTVAGIDRALGRRRELTALRLLGTPGRLLRRTQWTEAALPTLAGSLLAIVAGGYAGVTYLQLDEDRVMPLTTAFAVAAVAGVTSLLLAWVTTLGTTARLDPEHIRAE